MTQLFFCFIFIISHLIFHCTKDSIFIENQLQYKILKSNTVE